MTYSSIKVYISIHIHVCRSLSWLIYYYISTTIRAPSNKKSWLRLKKQILTIASGLWTKLVVNIRKSFPLSLERWSQSLTLSLSLSVSSQSCTRSKSLLLSQSQAFILPSFSLSLSFSSLSLLLSLLASVLWSEFDFGRASSLASPSTDMLFNSSSFFLDSFSLSRGASSSFFLDSSDPPESVLTVAEADLTLAVGLVWGISYWSLMK